MRAKTLFILILIFICVAFLTAFVIKHCGVNRYRKSVGTRIFSEIPWDRVYEIDIRGIEQNVTLVKSDGSWRVKEYYNYLADFSQISNLVEKLKGVSIGQTFKADRSILKRLMLLDPEDTKIKDAYKGKALILKDKKGKLIKKIIFGKAMKQQEIGIPAGQYVRFAGENTVYLIGEYITCLTQGPREWIRLEIVNIRPIDIKRIIGYKEGKERYVLENKKGEKEFYLKKGPDEVKKKIRRIKDGINYLTIEGVVDPKKASNLDSFGISPKNYVQYELFNGMIYKVYPSKKCGKEKCYIKLEIAYKGSDKVLLEKAKTQEKLLSPWIFEVSKWRHDSFFLP